MPLAVNVSNELGDAIALLALAAVLISRFVRTGGLPLLRRMNKPMQRGAHTTGAHAHGSQ